MVFVAYVAATALHIGWLLAHEPFSFDAWNVAKDTHAEPFSIRRFFGYWAFEYTHSNPRLGQPLTYLAYKLEYFAVIATPLAVIALSLAVFVLGTGRWPAWRRGRDLALWAIAIGFLWFALPQVGKTVFSRAYGANYLYTAVLQLWFLVPLRLMRARATTAVCVAYLFAGIAAGLCNEHTGPTLCLFMVGYGVLLRRRHDDPGARATSRFVLAGAAGAVLGFAAIFFAPGQGERYEGLAQHTSLFGRLLQRGIIGNLEIYRDLLLAAAPLLGLIVIAAVIGLSDETDPETRVARRRAFHLVGFAMVAATTITATVFVSPKLGPRFFLFSMSLLLAGFVGVADVLLTTPRRLAPFVALAVAASIYAGARTIVLFSRVSRQGHERLAALEHSKPGTFFTAESFEQVEDSWWFLGDDFRDIRKRELVTKYFDLAGVVLRAYDPSAPLGVSDVRLVPHYDLVPASCLDEHGGLELDTYRGLDISSIQKAMVTGVEQLRGRLGAARLDKLDLAVEFAGERPETPRPTLLVGRWRPTGLEAYAGQIVRKSRATTRDIVLPKELAGTDFEIYIYQVSGEAKRLGTARDAKLQYVPWKSGAYWALACRPQECFVFVATHQAG
ncbi:MAG: hypothetical protein JWO36_6679 [Myxococcales bacterium]|nr:hypothetical protein [Myxococcales bacterium]